jgi:transcriptional regulator
MRDHPFAHLFTARPGLSVTRLPFVVDVCQGRPARLRSHLDARNPQATGLDGTQVLVAFSGPCAYVSPHWRADKSRGGTYDYEEVQVRGTARVVQDVTFFKQLVDDLSTLIEPRHADVGAYPTWNVSMAPPNHIERQVDLVVPFVVHITDVQAIAKLHQQFPDADRRAVAEHLARSHLEGPRAIAARILGDLQRRPAAESRSCRAGFPPTKDPQAPPR